MAPYVDIAGLEVGRNLPSLTKPSITKKQLVRYAGASGDFNAIHTDDHEAQKSGLMGVIAQGPLIMGFAGQAICQWFPKRELRRFKVRFTGMSCPGDEITVSALVTEKTETPDGLKILCDVTANNQNGETKLSGQCEILTNRHALSRTAENEK